MTEVHTVARQIQRLEIYLNNLVSALTRGELPVNLHPVTQIFDNAISAIAPILNLSEDRFVELYNDIPQILTAYAIDATLSGDSYQKINENITFNRFHRGNYWIIPTQELIDRAWLVPNPLKNLSLDRMPSIDTSFDRDIINKDRSFHTYFLVKPALVQILPIVEPLTWKLLERGKITSSQVQKPTVTIAAIDNIYEQLGKNNYRQERLTYDQNILLEESLRTKDIIALQDKKIIFLELQIESLKGNKSIDSHTALEKLKEVQQRFEYDKSELVQRLDDQRYNMDFLQRQIKNIFEYFPEMTSTVPSNEKVIDLEKNIILNSIDIHNNLQSSQAEETELISINQEKNNSAIPELPKIHQEIVSEYYHNPKEFAIKYQVKVANITKDSINSNRDSEEKNVILEETTRGNYWIFNFGDDNYLVPVEGKYINQHSYTTTSTIFEGHNYTPDYQKIQLIKPAIVSIDPNTNPQTWRLQQQGELVFL